MRRRRRDTPTPAPMPRPSSCACPSPPPGHRTQAPPGEVPRGHRRIRSLAGRSARPWCWYPWRLARSTNEDGEAVRGRSSGSNRDAAAPSAMATVGDRLVPCVHETVGDRLVFSQCARQRCFLRLGLKATVKNIKGEQARGTWYTGVQEAAIKKKYGAIFLRTPLISKFKDA